MKQNLALDANLAALSSACVMEILNDMVLQLKIVTHSNLFAGPRQELLERSLEGIQLVVDHWIEEITGRRATARATSERPKKTPTEPKAPTNVMNAIGAMLAVYYDDIDEDDCTPMQQLRMLIAVHNLLVLYNEIRLVVQ